MENQEVNPIPQPQYTQQPTAGGPQVMMPGAILWMVFGIVSVVLCWYGFIPVAGIFLGAVSLVFGILAFINGKKMAKKFNDNPGMYKPASNGLIKTAKITGLIGLIISCVMIVISIIITLAATAESFHEINFN